MDIPRNHLCKVCHIHYVELEYIVRFYKPYKSAYSLSFALYSIYDVFSQIS